MTPQRCREDAHGVGRRINIKDLEFKPGPSRRERLKGDAGAPPTDPQGAAVAEQQATAIRRQQCGPHRRATPELGQARRPPHGLPRRRRQRPERKSRKPEIDSANQAARDQTRTIPALSLHPPERDEAAGLAALARHHRSTRSLSRVAEGKAAQRR